MSPWTVTRAVGAARVVGRLRPLYATQTYSPASASWTLLKHRPPSGATVTDGSPASRHSTSGALLRYQLMLAGGTEAGATHGRRSGRPAVTTTSRGHSANCTAKSERDTAGMVRGFSFYIEMYRVKIVQARIM